MQFKRIFYLNFPRVTKNKQFECKNQTKVLLLVIQHFGKNFRVIA